MKQVVACGRNRNRKEIFKVRVFVEPLEENWRRGVYSVG